MGRKIKRKGRFWVYMVESSAGFYYAGYTVDLEKRIGLHNSGRGSKCLRGKGPVVLAYSREYRYLRNVLRAERNLKQLTRSQKVKLARHWAERAGKDLYV